MFLFHVQIVTFLRKNDYTPKWVVDFPLERDTFRNKIMEIVEDSDEKSFNNNGKSWKSSRILRVNPFFSFFFLFSSFFYIFSFFFFFLFFLNFFIFLHFSIIFLHFPSFSFIFFHFLSFSFIFFHFLFWTRPIDRRCMSVRTRTRHDELIAIKLDQGNCAAVPRTARRIQSFVERHCDSGQKPPGNSFSITMFVYFHSFSIIFVHFLLFFFHLSLIFFSLLGAQNLIFFGPQFRYDFS